MAADAVLAGYLEAVAQPADAVERGDVELRRGQFHDVLMVGEIAYRFPCDEQSRRLLPGRAALPRALETRELPTAIASVVSDAAVGLPLGRSHVALSRVPGHPIEAEGAARRGQAGIAALAVVEGRPTGPGRT